LPYLTLKLTVFIYRFLPKFIAQKNNADLFDKVHCVFSNVPGPSEFLYIGEHKITKMYAA